MRRWFKRVTGACLVRTTVGLVAEKEEDHPVEGSRCDLIYLRYRVHDLQYSPAVPSSRRSPFTRC
jgi:hypothetical protein